MEQQGVCYPRNLNYGKASVDLQCSNSWVCYPRNLNYGKAVKDNIPPVAEVCYPRNLNYGKARVRRYENYDGFAILEI